MQRSNLAAPRGTTPRWLALLAAAALAACVAPAEPEPAPAPTTEAAFREPDPAALIDALRGGLTGYDPALGELVWSEASVSLDDGRGFDAVLVPITGARTERVLAARQDAGTTGFRTVVVDLAIVDATTGERTVTALHEIDGTARALPAGPIDVLIAGCQRSCMTFVQPVCNSWCADPDSPPSCWFECTAGWWTSCTVVCTLVWVWLL